MTYLPSRKGKRRITAVPQEEPPVNQDLLDQMVYSYSLNVTGAELRELGELMKAAGVDNVPALLKIAIKHLRDCPPASAKPAGKP